PWELLYDPLDDQFLALARDLVLVRYPPSPIGTMPTLAANPLRVLVILASPEGSDYSRINLDRELRRIRNALKNPLDRKQVVLDVIRGPDTLGQLRMQLRNPAQIVHILCHGDLDERSGEGVLIFEDADGAADLANAELLRQYFQRQRGHLRLVLLNACLGALPADDDPFSSVGAALLRSGVPAVIAMQFELPEDAAVELTQVFYAEAAAGAPIGMALTEARLQLYGRYPSRLDWAIPVLFLRTDMPIIDEWSGQNEPPVEVWSEEQELRTWAEQADHLSKSSLPDGEAIDALLTRIDQQHPGYRHPTIDLSALRRRVDLQRATQQITAGQGEAALTTLAGLFTQQKADRDAASLLVRLLLSESLDLNLRLRAMQLATEHGDLRPDVCTLPPALVPIAGGRFVIGSTREEIQRAGRSYERAYLERGDPMKAREARNWPNDEGNDQQLTLAAFAINRYLVTNAQYALFIADDGYDSARPWWQGARKRWLHTTSHTAPRDWPERKHLPNHPIVGITWYEAQAFCQWLSQHRSYNPQGHTYRLPNEAEWEYAVRGAERRFYPWGMQAPDIVHANFGGRHHDTTPVGCFLAGATPEGIYDLAGNVWEWTSSVYRPYPYRVTNARDRSDDVSGETFTVRGGCWRSPAALLRASHRHYYPPSHYDRNLGFRLIRELPATPEIQRRG
ncbi:MAG: SUMF1/EgtB/PvdO family nonheme iron enzyme, partial [Roseiflexaceae bacterium]